MTAGRWPWKSASAKECVTTHLPKRLALKMDGAKADPRYSTVGAVPALTPLKQGRPNLTYSVPEKVRIGSRSLDE